MYKVRVKGEGIKLAGVWRYEGETALIDKEDYEKQKDYIEVLEEIEDTNPEINNEEEPAGDDQNPEGEETPENNDEVGDTNVGDIAGNEEESDDEELEALKEKAKELGINVTHNMKKETIIKKIEEKEASEEPAGDDQNPEGE